jgi:hypothetical protein
MGSDETPGLGRSNSRALWAVLRRPVVSLSVSAGAVVLIAGAVLFLSTQPEVGPSAAVPTAPPAAETTPPEPSGASPSEPEAIRKFVAAAEAEGLTVVDGAGEFAGFVIAFDDVTGDGKFDAGTETALRGVQGILADITGPRG